MAQNPMQRKMTNAFLLGMLITVLIAAIIVGYLLMRINKLNDEKEEISTTATVSTKFVYVATSTIPEGEIAYGSDSDPLIQQMTVATDMDTSLLLSSDDLYVTNDAGEEEAAVLKANIQIEEGTVITKSMLSTDSVDSSERLMEYNMISLPSQLLAGAYIDIRLLLPSGEDFVVVSKKYVEDADYTTIWLKMSEAEIETLSNAIIESYIIDGCKLYATEYTSPESQAASTCTYMPNDTVTAIIKAMGGDILSGSISDMRNVIQNYLNLVDTDEQLEKTAEGIEEEVTATQSARDEFLESMGY